MLDIHTIGAGGGSVAWLDAGGAPRVGPRSAGADPGPACYGLGGTEPTVTDANLLLGRINPCSVLGDKKELDPNLARHAIEDRIAQPLSLTAEAAAEGIIKVVNANMARALRLVSVRRGHDPREYALLCFGGAGPLHGAALALELEMPQVVIPCYPGVTSALGMLRADVRLDFSRTCLAPINNVSPDRLCEQYAVMEREGTDCLAKEGFDRSRISLVRQADLRYAGQSYEITLPLPAGILSENELEQLRRSFHAAHERAYGWRREEAEVELVTLRLAALGRLPMAGGAPASLCSGKPEPAGFREVYFTNGFVTTPVYRREALAPGFVMKGPAVVEQDDSTTLLHPGMTGRCDGYGNLIIVQNLLGMQGIL
jgi:N-methylhydantoinase A